MNSIQRSGSRKARCSAWALLFSSVLAALPAGAQVQVEPPASTAAEAWRLMRDSRISRQTLPDGQLLLVRGERIRRVGNITYADGNVSVEVGGVRIECQSLEYDPDTGIAKARQECIFFWDDNYACAETIDFDTRTRTAVMHKVSGRGNDLATNSKQFEEPLFFWAEDLTWKPDKIEMNTAVLTTCDLVPQDYHYRLESDKIEVYPKDHLDARGTAVNVGSTRLFTLPLVRLSLDGKHELLQDFIPRPGYSGQFGAYIRSKIPFSFDKQNFGKIQVALYSKTGLAYGFEDTFTLGKKGGGDIYYYRQSGGGDAEGRLDFHTSLAYQLDKYTNVGFSYGQNKSELPGLTSPLNVNTSVALTRNEPGSSFSISSNYSRSGDNTNTGYQAYYEKDFGERTTALISADYALASTLNARTQRYHYLGDLLHRGDWFDAEAVFEESSGQSTFFLNREPEIRFRTHPFYLGTVPFVATATYGIVTESPSDIRTTRGEFRLFVPDQTLDWGSGRAQLGGGFRELFYGTQDSERIVTARASAMENLNDNLLARVDFNMQLPSGSTPFQSDVVYQYESLTAGLEFYNQGNFRLSAYGGYDLYLHQAHDFVGRFDYGLSDRFTISTGLNFDPIGRDVRSVDTQFNWQIKDNLYLTYWTVYDFTLQKQSYQDFMVKLSEHDWDASLAYRGTQNEFYFQFSLKAFPAPPVKIGPNTSAPILPQNLPNAFVR